MAVLQRRSPELPDGTRHAVDLLDTDLRRFRRMVDDLLEISRDEHDTDRSTFELLDLGALVQVIAAQHGPVPTAKVDIADHPWVMADRRRLERAVANLLDNAEHHGGGLVRLGVLHHDGDARIEIDDAGPGVPDQAREHVFERFARGATARQDTTSGGAGLGLALVNQHIHRHGGRVWVEDRPGGGARFVIELPDAVPAPSA